VNPIVLSGTAAVVPSGTRSSCYRGPKSKLTLWRSTACSPRNFPNLESFGSSLTDGASGAPVDRQAVAAGKPSATWPCALDVVAPVRVRVCPLASLCKLWRTT
jgi:hypothetical protein